MRYREKVASRRTRIALSIVIWAVLGPMFIALEFWANWAFAFFMVLGLWVTVDYVRRGTPLEEDDWPQTRDWFRAWGWKDRNSLSD